MENSKQLSFANLFFLWFGAAVSVAEILTGGILAPLGLSKGMWAIFWGHLAGTVLLVLAGVIGYREKLPSIMSTRISFGKNGSYMISVINILQLMGWTAVMILEGGNAVNELTKALWGLDNAALAAGLIGVFIGLWVFIGIHGFKIVNMIAVSLLFVLTLVLSWVLFTSPTPANMESSGSFGFGFELSIIMPLSWFPLIADYTSMAKSRRSSWLAPFLGYFIGSCWMYGIGLVGAIHSGTADPSQMMLAANLGVVALLIIGLSTVTTTFMDVFSAAMSTLNIAPNLSQRWTAVVFAALGTGMAMFFPIEQYINFLYILGSVFAPLIAILLSDYFLFATDNRDKTFDPVAGGSMVAGIAFYYLAAQPMELPLGATVWTILFAFLFHCGARRLARR